MTAAEGAEILDRWQRGEAFEIIGRAFDRYSDDTRHQYEADQLGLTAAGRTSASALRL
jgi:hypothetical protein